LAITEISSGWVGVLGTDDGGVLTVDLATGTPRHNMPGDSGRVVTGIACAQIVGRSVAILTDNRDGTQIIDLLSGEAIDVGLINARRLGVSRRPASALIVIQGALVEVRGAEDGEITLLRGNLSTHLGFHNGEVTAVACTYLNDRPVAFTGDRDGIVQVWDLLGGRLLDAITALGPVFAIEATNDGELVIGAGGEALAFRHASAGIQPPGGAG
jgi:hypothetical protein